MEPKNKFQILFDLLNWTMTHKKAVLIILTAISLFVIIIFIIVQIFRGTLPFFSRPKEDSIPEGRSGVKGSVASMQIQTDRANYSVNDQITVVVSADSKGQSITGFDAVISYDPKVLQFIDRKDSLPDYYYFVQNLQELLQISAVQKAEAPRENVFNNTELVRLVFKPLKPGKVSFRLISAPKTTNESNLINKDSQDVLSIIYGKDIEIK